MSLLHVTPGQFHEYWVLVSLAVHFLWSAFIRPEVRMRG
jgi:hypothetical protein